MKPFEITLEQLPGIRAGIGLWQNEFHEFTVYDHTLVVVEEVKAMDADDNLIAAAWLHDIAKPTVATLREYDGIPQMSPNGPPYHTFNGHEVVGEHVVRAFTTDLFVPYSLNQDYIARLVGAHFLPMTGIKNLRKATDMDEFIKAFKSLEDLIEKANLPKDELMKLFMADCMGKGNAPHDQPELLLVRNALLGTDCLQEIYDIQKNGSGFGYYKKE